MPSKAVSIVIVTWNSIFYIRECLESVISQTFKDFSITVIDNRSSDGTVEFLRENYPTVHILQNFKNLGFSKANNQGIKLSNAEYVLVMNPDVVLEKNFLHRMVAFANEHKGGGSFTGRVFRITEKNTENYEGVAHFCDLDRATILDTTGIVMKKNRTSENRGEGLINSDNFDKAVEIFGVSGCCALYRKEALNDVRIRDEYFDESFFAYKEDVDLAWRLRLYGWESWYAPNAYAYHHRSFRATQEKGIMKKMTSRKKISKFVRILSTKNQHLLLVKNDYFSNFFKHIIPIAINEIKLLLAIIVAEPFLVRAVKEFFSELRPTYSKRKIIMSHAKISAKEIRKWFR